MAACPSQPNRPVARLVTTDEDVALRIAALMPGSVVKKRKRREEHHKQAWTISLYGARAVRAMADLRPLMMSRRRAAIDKALRGYRPVRSTSLIRALGLDQYVRRL